MKLDYRILWIEDTQSFYESAFEGLEVVLADEGFRLKATNLTNGDDLEAHARDPRYDLILMDYNLGDADAKSQENGNELIQKIRSFGIYTEIVFYSGAPPEELRQILYKTGNMNGIYYFKKDNNLEDNIFQVIHTTIKKVMDVNNMRGMVMASIANCDVHQISAITNYATKLNAKQRSTLKADIISELDESAKNYNSKVKELRDQPDIGVLLQSKYVQSLNRYKTLRVITEIHKNSEPIKEIHERSTAFPLLLDKRNTLAHAKAEEDAEGKVVFKGSDDVIWDEEKFRELRLDLIKHEDNYETLSRHIESDKFS